ncbi:MAG: DUF2339 domain-containing protein, partial [Planctomycetaceae bacterium]|nr:DUF2339 domain-containing protein [Planctomycetaceae bacterium]
MIEFLFFVPFILFLLFSGPAALIWLLFLRKRLADITEQNRRLESTLRRLQNDIAPHWSESPFKQEQPAQPIRPAAPIVPVSTSVAQQPAPSTPQPVSAAQQPALYKPQPALSQPQPDWSKKSDSTTPPSLKKIEKPEEIQWQSLELWIGQKLFGWVAVVGFIVAAALFIQYAVTMGWVTNVVKVLAIALFGTALLGVGFYSRRTGLQRFSTMMSSAGIILIYQAGYASYGFYHLISASTASVFMPIIVIGGFLLAWLYRSKLLGIVSILGGLAVPILVSTGTDRHVELFIYLMSLNIGTLILVNLLRRAPIAWIAFFGTQALFHMWASDYYKFEHLTAALLFQSAFYVVFLADTAIAALNPIGKRLIPTWDDAMRAVLAPIIFFGEIFLLSQSIIHIEDGITTEIKCDILQDNLGIIAFVGAAWYALLAVLYKRWQTADGSLQQNSLPSLHWQAAPTAAVVIAFGFVAIGIPLQFQAMWFTLGWLTVFAGLWYFGHRQTNKAFVVMSVIFFGLGMFRFLTEIEEQLSGVQRQLDLTPVFNTIAMPMLASMVVLIIAAVLTGRYLKTADHTELTTPTPPKEGNYGSSPPLEGCPTGRGGSEYVSLAGTPCSSSWAFNHFIGILGYVLLGVVLSAEAARYFYAQTELWEPYNAHYLYSAFLLGFWFALTILLLEVGFVFRSKVLTDVACCGLAMALLAVIFTGFSQRLAFQEAFHNPFSIVLIAGSIILLGVGYQSTWTKTYRDVFDGFGIAGLLMLLVILTIEWFLYFKPMAGNAPTFRSITLFWTIYALVWIALGFAARSMPVRVCGMIILFAALIKTTFFDSTFTFGYGAWEWLEKPGYSLGNWIPLTNPYFLTMLIPVIPAMALAVWTNRNRRLPFVGEQERIAWKVAGIIGLVALLIYLSIECHQYFEAIEPRLFDKEQIGCLFLASTSLTVFWTIAALILTVLAWCYHSRSLRVVSMVLLVLTVLKVLLDLEVRPEFTTPFWNPYFMPTFAATGMLIALGCLWVRQLKDAQPTERNAYYILALGGIIFLWLTMSVECFRSFGVIETQHWAMKQKFLASASLTIFWTTFAAVLTIAAWYSRSAALRMISMSLLILTALKICF